MVLSIKYKLCIRRTVKVSKNLVTKKNLKIFPHIFGGRTSAFYFLFFIFDKIDDFAVSAYKINVIQET